MSGVFQTIDPPPPHRPASVYPPSLVRGEDPLAWGKGGGGSIVWKTPDSALYSAYVSTLCPIFNPGAQSLLSGSAGAISNV
jgi:hypothetical protein